MSTQPEHPPSNSPTVLVPPARLLPTPTAYGLADEEPAPVDCVQDTVPVGAPRTFKHSSRSRPWYESNIWVPALTLAHQLSTRGGHARRAPAAAHSTAHDGATLISVVAADPDYVHNNISRTPVQNIRSRLGMPFVDGEAGPGGGTQPASVTPRGDPILAAPNTCAIPGVQFPGATTLAAAGSGDKHGGGAAG